MIERTTIDDRIRKKEAEIQQLEERIKAARIYVQALKDLLKASESAGDGDVKAGSMLDQVRDAIRAAGRPLHVNDLLRAIGRSEDSKNSLTGSLAAYVRRGEVFTRPQPNTFGLVEFEEHRGDHPAPPPGFGERPSSSFDDDMGDDVPF